MLTKYPFAPSPYWGFNGEKHIIPNGQIKEVTNFSRSDYIAFFDMEVSRDADADRALDILME